MPNTTPLVVPDGFKVVVALLLIGLALEGIGRVSPQAAYWLAVLVILGFAATGGRLENVVGWFRAIGVLAQPTP